MKNMIAFVACCCYSLLTYGASSQQEPEKDISFYQTNLVCGAASDIGCGTRAKPMLAAFMQHPDVEEAWLNHTGTVIAVVWKENAASKEAVANNVFGKWEKPFLTLTGEKEAAQLSDFNSGKWYKGDDVDQLSLIEADRIATQLVSRVRSSTDFSEDQLQTLHEAFEAYIAEEFLAIEDATVIDQMSFWQRWEKDLTAIGKQHLGDDMPAVQFVSGNAQPECKTGKSCCTGGSQQSCCTRKTEGTNEYE
ncbi:MAG: hypothetical protein R3301_15980 [Saprospiraceae bacterium]|nr:hypothetical protein [Saprospiraceae bacterium]